jgi:enoyl-CoA hydratase
MTSALDYEKVANQIGILRINRPDVLNAINSRTLEELLQFLQHNAIEDGCKALILTGAGEKSFIAGADIKEMQEMTAIEMLKFCQLGQQVTLALEQAPFLTIAAVNGYALGGGLEMALACDFIYASKNVKMGAPEVSLGIIPGFGGTQRLTRVVGSRLAKELIMTGQTFLSDEAHAMGIVNKLFSSDALLPACLETANAIIKHSFTAIMQAKRAIAAASEMPLPEALELERNMCALCFTTEEHAQEMASFLEKRGRR